MIASFWTLYADTPQQWCATVSAIGIAVMALIAIAARLGWLDGES